MTAYILIMWSTNYATEIAFKKKKKQAKKTGTDWLVLYSMHHILTVSG